MWILIYIQSYITLLTQLWAYQHTSVHCPDSSHGAAPLSARPPTHTTSLLLAVSLDTSTKTVKTAQIAKVLDLQHNC